MKVEEFRMFVHGPFATNIHIDARQVRRLKTVIARRPLSLTEFYILKSLNSTGSEKKTRDDLITEIKQETKITSSDVYLALKNLESTHYVNKSEDPNRRILKSLETQYAKGGGYVRTKLLKRSPEDLDIRSKNLFSITQEGKEELKKTYKEYYEQFNPNSEVDIVNDVTHTNLVKFWEEIDAESNIDSYKFLDQVFLKPEVEVSFFSQEDRPVLLAKFHFEDFTAENLSLEADRPDVNLKFEKNAIYIYPSGVGMFSTQVTVRYTDDINQIKDKLEVKVNEIIQENFRKQGSQIKIDKYSSKVKYGNLFKLVDVFKLESAKVTNPAWTHIIYWFYGNEFFEYDAENRQKLRNNISREFTDLLEQPPENTLFLRNHLVFYGWGRSLILTDKSDQNTEQWVRTEKWVRNKVSLVEVGQYSCFGHILLDYLLQRVLVKLTDEEPIVDQSTRILKSGIEDADIVRSAATVYLDELQSGINAILHAGEPFLVKTLENQWRLDKVEESIRNKLESLYNQRSAMEQSLVTEKQDRMNVISSAFTIMGIAGVTAAIVALSPLNKWLEQESNFWSLFNQVMFFIVATIVIIILALTIIFKWRDINHWIYYKISSWNHVRHYKRRIKNPLTLEQNLGVIKREVKDLFDRKKINRSQYLKLEKEIERYRVKVAFR